MRRIYLKKVEGDKIVGVAKVTAKKVFYAFNDQLGWDENDQYTGEGFYRHDLKFEDATEEEFNQVYKKTATTLNDELNADL